MKLRPVISTFVHTSGKRWNIRSKFILCGMLAVVLVGVMVGVYLPDAFAKTTKPAPQNKSQIVHRPQASKTSEQKKTLVKPQSTMRAVKKQPVKQPVLVPPKQPTQKPSVAPARPAINQAAPSGSVESMIYQVFGPTYGPGAVRVARCESGLNPAATNAMSIGGSRAAGIFQILYPSTWNGTPQGRAGLSPYNAMANIQAAHSIFVRDGYSWREWVCRP